MARSVADLRRLLHVLAGWDADDPCAVPAGAEAAPYQTAPEVWWFDTDARAPSTPETRAAVAVAVAGLAAQGYAVRPGRPAAFDDATALWDVFFGDAGEMLLTAAIGEVAPTLPILAAMHRERGPRPPLTALGLTEAWAARDVLRGRFTRELQGRVVVCPVTAMPAFVHGERQWTIDGRTVGYLDAMIYTPWANILGAPAAVVPAGRSGTGLPIGVQVIGAPFMEAAVLDVAAAIERACGGVVPPPSGVTA
jgi:amidase